MCVLARHRFKPFRKEENMLGMEQNESFKGNEKWVFTVQRRSLEWSHVL